MELQSAPPSSSSTQGTRQGFVNLPDSANEQWLSAMAELRNRVKSNRRGDGDKVRLEAIECSLKHFTTLCCCNDDDDDGTPTFLSGSPPRTSLKSPSGPLDDSASGIVDGRMPQVYHIMQGEAGFTVAVPNAASPDSFIMSSDATSCLIVACRVTLLSRPDSPSAVAMTHLDHGGAVVRNTLLSMLFEMAVPALEELLRDGTTAGDGGLGTALHVHAEWYLVGAMVDMRYAMATLSDALFFLHQLVSTKRSTALLSSSGKEIVLVHSLRPDGVCIWHWNTSNKDLKDLSNPVAVEVCGRRTGTGKTLPVCRTWGIVISARTGECAPASYLKGSRNFNAAVLRGMLTPPDEEHSLLLCPTKSSAPVAASSGIADPLAAKVLSIPLTAQEETIPLTFADFVARLVASVKRGLACPVLLRPCSWSGPEDPTVRRLKAASDAELLTYSTTPQCEPLDFCETFRKRFVACSLVRSVTVFGQDLSRVLLIQPPAVGTEGVQIASS